MLEAVTVPCLVLSSAIGLFDARRVFCSVSHLEFGHVQRPIYGYIDP